MPPVEMRTGHNLRFLFLFSVIYTGFLVIYFLVPNSFLTNVVYNKGIIAVSSGIINYVAPDEEAHGKANKIISKRISLKIVRGCDGAGATFLLMAAIIAFPACFKKKLFGLFASLTLVYVLNQIRIVGLYFVAVYHYSWFDLFHVYLVPTIIIIISCMFFVWWLRWSMFPHEDDKKPETLNLRVT